MSSEYTLNGKIAAVNEVQVFPLLAGQVQTLNVSEGDTVSKGQTLFTVDTSTVTSTMSSLQQSYSATKTATDRAIESAKVGVEQAELAVSNTEALLEACGCRAGSDQGKAGADTGTGRCGAGTGAAVGIAGADSGVYGSDQQAGKPWHGNRSVLGYGYGCKRRPRRHGILGAAERGYCRERCG